MNQWKRYGEFQKNGKVIIKVPIFPSVWAMADPTHKQFFTYMTFNYFRQEDNLNYYSKAMFRIAKRVIVFTKYFKPLLGFFHLSEKMQKFYYIFPFLLPANSLYFELETLK